MVARTGILPVCVLEAAALRFSDRSQTVGFFSLQNWNPSGVRPGGRSTSILRQKPNCWLLFSPELESFRCASWRPQHFDSQTEAKLLASFLSRTGILPVCVLKAAALRFSDRSQTVGFFSDQKKTHQRWVYFGQNWNRTSDTRIFSPLLYQLSYPAMNSKQPG
ncbi:MAG: hypothetical protein RLZZ453_977 [Chlamydiota bacterium]